MPTLPQTCPFLFSSSRVHAGDLRGTWEMLTAERPAVYKQSFESTHQVLVPAPNTVFHRQHIQQRLTDASKANMQSIYSDIKTAESSETSSLAAWALSLKYSPFHSFPFYPLGCSALISKLVCLLCYQTPIVKWSENRSVESNSLRPHGYSP